MGLCVVYISCCSVTFGQRPLADNVTIVLCVIFYYTILRQIRFGKAVLDSHGTVPMPVVEQFFFWS